MAKFTSWLLSMVVASLVAAQPGRLATASSEASFTIRGESINSEGVPLWPLTAGAEIAAQSAPVVLTFADESRVALAPGARGKVEELRGRAAFRLLEGEVAYNLRRIDSIALNALDRAVDPSALTGAYGVGPTGGATAAGGAALASKFWSAPASMALVLGGAAAVAAAAVMATDSPSSVSPSQ